MTTGFERGPIAWMICRSLMIPYNVVPNPAGNGRCQARKWPTGQSTGLSSNGSSCRTEFRSRICARHGPPRPHLHRDTVGFVGSGAGCGRSRSNPSKDSRPKWRFCCKIGAPAHSPHPLAPTHPPLQCAAPQTRNRVVPLSSPLVASAWRCIEALPNGQPFAPLRSRTRVRPSSGGTALNKNSSRSHAMLTIKVRRGGPYMQHATCSAAVPG